MQTNKMRYPDQNFPNSSCKNDKGNCSQKSHSPHYRNKMENCVQNVKIDVPQVN